MAPGDSDGDAMSSASDQGTPGGSDRVTTVARGPSRGRCDASPPLSPSPSPCEQPAQCRQRMADGIPPPPHAQRRPHPHHDRHTDTQTDGRGLRAHACDRRGGFTIWGGGCWARECAELWGGKGGSVEVLGVQGGGGAELRVLGLRGEGGAELRGAEFGVQGLGGAGFWGVQCWGVQGLRGAGFEAAES